MVKKKIIFANGCERLSIETMIFGYRFWKDYVDYKCRLTQRYRHLLNKLKGLVVWVVVWCAFTNQDLATNSVDIINFCGCIEYCRTSNPKDSKMVGQRSTRSVPGGMRSILATRLEYWMVLCNRPVWGCPCQWTGNSSTMCLKILIKIVKQRSGELIFLYSTAAINSL